ncbi:MAG: hypothetical protein QGH40_16950, partial [bacterium]|nr:hypothetical protein [bacterium]
MLVFSGAKPAYPLSANLRWVEIDCSLRPDGKAIFVYKICYLVRTGEMHGFDMMGFGHTPVFNRERSRVIGSDRRKQSLSIVNKGGGKYAIDIADQSHVGPGKAIFVIVYAADVAEAGQLAFTENEEFGPLTVFHWAPVQWDEPMEHETIHIYYPLEVPQEDIQEGEVLEEFHRDTVKFMTEKFMNKRYLISYLATENKGKEWFTVRLHKNDLSRKYHFRVQQYVSRSILPLQEASVGDLHREGTDLKFSMPWISETGIFLKRAGFLVLLGLAAFMMIISKHRSLYRAAIKLPDIQWESDDWVPPKIQVASFRVKNKLAELDPVEAAMLLDYPVSRILSLMIYELKERAVLEIVSESPLNIKILSRYFTPENQYEKLLVEAVGEDGNLDRELVHELLQEIADNLQRKAWNCDLEATKSHYLDEFKKASLPLSSDEDMRETY